MKWMKKINYYLIQRGQRQIKEKLVISYSKIGIILLDKKNIM